MNTTLEKGGRMSKSKKYCINLRPDTDTINAYFINRPDNSNFK